MAVDADARDDEINVGVIGEVCKGMLVFSV